MKNKKIIFVYALFAIIGIAFLGCNKEKITEYEKTIEQLNSQIALLQTENNELKNEIEAYKQTDQYFYQSGADEFLKENYQEALVWLGKLKVKFPASSLLVYANKIIDDSKSQIDKQPAKNTAFKSSLKFIPGIGDIPKKPID